MPQEHQVLRCFSCETFQVHIVKKSNKWDCKVCGSKQSVKRNYGKGSGKDCRNQVMKLNELRILGGNSSKLMISDDTPEEAFTEEFVEQNSRVEKSSKWNKYLEETIESEESENEENPTNCLSEIVINNKKRTKKPLERDQKCSKKIHTNSKISGKSPSKVHNELNPSYSAEDIFERNDKKFLSETKIQSNNYEKCPTESKYAKYLDDDNNTTQVNVSSNIFNSGFADLDSILNL